MQGLWEALKPGHEDETLARALDPQRLPAHIAIIMDGNGRWAKRRGQLRVAGHKAGMRPVRTVIGFRRGSTWLGGASSARS